MTCALAHGSNVLGGRGPLALHTDTLEGRPEVATIHIEFPGPAVIRRTTAAVVVKLDDIPLGIGPADLHDGAVIHFEDCRFVFEDDDALAPASAGGSLASPSPRAADTARDGYPRLSVRTNGAACVLGNRRVVIGREEQSDLLLRDRGVSRRHASVTPVDGGFLLRDESANGTSVNGVAIAGSYLLADGDVITVGDVEIDVEFQPRAERPIATGDTTAMLDRSALLESIGVRGREITASLEVMRGPFTGASFQLDRPVCSIGRGERNDVRLPDDSVSTTHASLLRKGRGWVAVDLRSVNGTWVNGSRIAGEREITSGARLRVGTIEMRFRAYDNGIEMPARRERASGLMRLQRLLRRMVPRRDD